jgi:hypothetical protein
MRSCPHLPFEGRKQDKIKKIIILNCFGFKKNGLGRTGDYPPVFSEKYFIAASKNGKKNW